MSNNSQTPPQANIPAYGAVDLAQLGHQRDTRAQEGTGVMQLPDAVIDGSEAALDQFAQLSAQLPVLVEMYSQASGPSALLAEIVRSAEGRLVLLRLNLDAQPALGAQPQVLALLAGRPAPLFTSVPPREQLVQVVSQVLAIAQQQGLTGQVEIVGEPGDAPTQPPLPPLHQEAREALERGDIAAAKDAYQRALAESPADDAAKVGLAQVSLLERLQGKTLQQIREAAAANPNDIAAQFAVADLDISGGHVDDAFNRLLELFQRTDAEGKARVRERLIELFTVVGADEPRVNRARSKLTSLLFA